MPKTSFREIADSAPAILWVTDAAGLCTYLSRQWYEFTGQTADEGLGMGWVEAVHPDDRASSGEIFMAANQRQEPFRLDYRLRRHDGVYRWAVDAGRPYFSADGEYLGQVGSVLDLTERKEAENALRQSEARYRRLVETMREGVWILDASDRTSYVNERMTELVGYPAEEMLGALPANFAADDDARQDMQRALAAWRDAAGDVREARLRRRDGKEISALINANPLFSESGAFEGTLVMVMDITVHRELERRLLQSQKMEAIGRLAGGVAHDFNNLLTAIGGNTRLAIDQLDAENPIRADLLEIEQAVGRARMLTRQLLAFSRPEASRPVVLDLNALIVDFERMLRRTMGTDIRIEVHLDDALPHVRADAVQLEQVLLNLANNARDAMPKGGTLSIDTRRVPRADASADAPGRGEEDLARITVADTGVGMDESTRLRIFDPFFTTKARGEGTGLGLATVHGIIAGSGGCIEVASQPGAGSRFTILLPTTHEPLPQALEASTLPLPRGSERILVVEDDSAVRSLAVRMLERLGYKVVQTDAADEAYRLLRAGDRFDLVLSDMVMPGMSGRDLAAALAILPEPVSLLLMSGYSPEQARPDAGPVANVPFLEKPFTAEELARAVRTALDAVHSQRSARPQAAIDAARDTTVSREPPLSKPTNTQENAASRAAELSAIVSALGDIVLVLDSEGRYRRIETTSAPLLYRPSHQLIGKRMHEVFPVESADLFLAQIRKVFDSGKTEYIEYTLPIRDELVWFSGAISRLSSTEVVWVARDISERKRQEEALDRMKRAAERANRAKSAFLSRVSHELRTPMNAILGFAQVLEQDIVKPENRESVDHILRAGTHLLGVIDDMLDISSIEQGRISLSLEAISVQDALETTLGLVRHMAEEKDVSLTIDPLHAPTDWHVRADPKRLRQVLVILLSNAIRYNRPGGRVTLSVTSADADSVRITVADTGYGISEHQLPRVFTAFDRLDAEKHGIQGVGLGLTVAKGLVNAMGGELEVESTPEVGSRFSVVLACTEPLLQTDADRPEDGVAPVTPPGQQRTVLYIEDHPANLTLVQRILRRRPHVRLLLAMQGDLGLKLAAEHRPDLLLLDRNLPDMTGDEILQRVRHDPDLRHMPVVIISGDALPEHVEQLRERGADAYLTKPFDVAELLSLLDRYLENGDGAP